jgi:signal transduction histidine kinase
VTVFILGYISYISILSFLEKDAQEDHAFSVIEKLEHVLSTVIDAETGQRGFIITGEQRYLQPYYLSLQNIDNQLHELNIMTSANTDSPKVKNMINSSLIPLIQNKLAELNETINVREHQGFNAALQVVLSDKGKRITDDIRTDITNMENEENNLLANRAKQLEAVGNNTIYTITVAILIASLVTALSIIVINNRTNRKHLEDKKLLENEVQVRTKQLHESNKQLALANEQLKIHDKMQRDFINVAAHELRTPIQPILSLTQIIRDRMSIKKEEKQVAGEAKKEREQMELCQLQDVVITSAKRLRRLTDDILDVSRIETHTLTLQKERFDLNDLISNIIQDCKNQLEKQGGSLIADNGHIPTDANLTIVYKGSEKKISPIFVEADKQRISQVVWNLLNNAIKFTREGGTLTITVEKKKKGNKAENEEAVVSIKDTGTGIDPEIRPRLFEKFASKSYHGTGLGLFIAKSIVEAHGGRIWAEDNPEGKGVTFSFTLHIISY